MAGQDPKKASAEELARLAESRNLVDLAAMASTLSTWQLVTALERVNGQQRALVYRVLPKTQALEVFETLAPALQSELVADLQTSEVATLFEELDPDDRVWLLDELPAKVARRLLLGLSENERQLTSDVLNYPRNSIGRRMSPEVLAVRASATVREALTKLRSQLHTTETIYTLPVVDDHRQVVGVVSLRDLLGATDTTPLHSLMHAPETALTTETAETASRRCIELGLLALPIVDSESRLVGILTIDDAARIVEDADSEDSARQGGSEPLRRPYLSAPIAGIVRSRLVWLFVLAVGATLTVQVLSAFESTLTEVTALALFIPLLIGTGGNTGNQAATTVTRALALHDIEPRDIIKVLTRELKVGVSLGLLLGAAGYALTSILYGTDIGTVIGLALLAICTLAATVGGVMPLAARAIRVDPAVFSNPFITTFVDATGLVIYFLIARAILGL